MPINHTLTTEEYQGTDTAVLDLQHEEGRQCWTDLRLNGKTLGVICSNGEEGGLLVVISHPGFETDPLIRITLDKDGGVCVVTEYLPKFFDMGFELKLPYESQTEDPQPEAQTADPVPITHIWDGRNDFDPTVKCQAHQRYECQDCFDEFIDTHNCKHGLKLRVSLNHDCLECLKHELETTECQLAGLTASGSSDQEQRSALEFDRGFLTMNIERRQTLATIAA